LGYASVHTYIKGSKIKLSLICPCPVVSTNHRTNGFVNGIQDSFADSQTNSFINRVLSANGLSNVIPTSSRKVERWDTCWF
jgi:hypothetical protein